MVRTCTRSQDHYITTFAAAIAAKEPTLSNDRRAIEKWIKTGNTDDPNMKKKLNILFEPYTNNVKVNFKIPIWWSGFYTESTEKDSPLKDMISAALYIDGFSTMNIRLAEPSIFNAQADFWACCKEQLDDKNKFNLYNKNTQDIIDPAKWGNAYSKQFTEQALNKNPDKLVYFFNKEKPNDVSGTFFYKTEFPVIVKYCKTYFDNNDSKPVDFYIFDIQKSEGHCEAVKEILKDHMRELLKIDIEGKDPITFHCYTKPTLLECSSELLKEIRQANKLENKTIEPTTKPTTKPSKPENKPTKPTKPSKPENKPTKPSKPENKPEKKLTVRQTKKSTARVNSIKNTGEERSNNSTKRGKRGGKQKRKSYRKKSRKKNISYIKR